MKNKNSNSLRLRASAAAMKTISLKLSDGLTAKLDAACKRNKASRSEVIRQALEVFLARQTRKLSAYEKAPHLAGCIDSGVGDLSYNKKHMEGYGE